MNLALCSYPCGLELIEARADSLSVPREPSVKEQQPDRDQMTWQHEPAVLYVDNRCPITVRGRGLEVEGHGDSVPDIDGQMAPIGVISATIWVHYRQRTNCSSRCQSLSAVKQL